jgi:O-antigen/teichoic acid export membrane protein
VVLATIPLRLPEFVVAHRFDAATFAVFAVGCLQIPFVDFVSSPASDLMMVRMSEALADGRPEAARASWFDAVSGLALVFFPFAGVLALGAHELIVLLYTADYAASVPIFRLWALTILFVPLLCDAALRVFAETRFLILVNLGHLVVLVAAIGPALDHFGLPGAVVAGALAMAAGRAIALGRIRRRLATGPVLPWRDLGLVLAAAALAFPAGRVAKWLAGDGTVAALLAGGAVYAAVYLLLVWRWGLAPELAALVRRALARLAPEPARTEAGAR